MDEKSLETLAALPQVVGMALHELANCNASLHALLKKQPQEGTVRLVQDADFQELNARIFEIKDILIKLGTTIDQEFWIDEKTLLPLSQVINHLITQGQWRFQIDTKLNTQGEFNLNWRRFRQVVQMLLTYLNSLAPDSVLSPLILSSKLKNNQTLLIQFQHPQLVIDPTEFQKIKSPFKAGLTTKIPIDQLIASAIVRGTDISFYPNFEVKTGCEITVEIDL